MILWQLASRKNAHEACETKEQLPDQLQNGRHEPFILDTPVAYAALVHRGWSLNPANRPLAKTMEQSLKEITPEEQSMRGLKG